MRTRPGFARLRPLFEIATLLACAVALRWCEWPPMVFHLGASPWRPIPRLPARVPYHDVVDAYGRRWTLSDMRGHRLVGLDLRGAEWFGVDLRRASFVRCDFRAADLRLADLRRTHLRQCNFLGADMFLAHIGGASYDRSTQWPAGFDPQAHGARLEE